MREKKFIDQVQEAAHENRIWMPPTDGGIEDLRHLRTSRNWPLCLTCGREVEAVDLKNVNATSFEVWASCSHKGHKNPPDEDYYRVVFPFRIEGDVMADERANTFLKRAMHDFCPFPRSHQE